MIKRDAYIEQLDHLRGNGRIKVVTGIRRCGKSFILFKLFKDFLINDAVPEENVITVALDNNNLANLRNPLRLDAFLREKINQASAGRKYVLIDEIQYCYKIKRDDTDLRLVAPEDREALYVTFYDVLNGILELEDVDIYVTGSNSRMLSTDIATIFRGRGDVIPIFPLSFAEFHAFRRGEKSDDWEEYLIFGGFPAAVSENDEPRKRQYLQDLFQNVYLKDILERHRLRNDSTIIQLANVLWSGIGSLTNPHKLTNTLRSRGTAAAHTTVDDYLRFLTEAFLFTKVERYNVKGKDYLDSPYKYYATDVGLRNACLNWRQQEPSHLQENIIFNELLIRRYAVDVGVVDLETRTPGGKREHRQHEIDFVVNAVPEKIYIQSALNLDSEEKNKQETLPLIRSGDSFRKIIVTGGNERQWCDENGIIHVGIIPFLLDKEILR